MAMQAAVLEWQMSDPINEALLIYTGYGSSTFPRARTPQLVSRFGESEGSELKHRILTLLGELQQPVASDGKRSRKSVTEQAIEQLRPRHPELDESALKALAWTFAFGLRLVALPHGHIASFDCSFFWNAASAGPQLSVRCRRRCGRRERERPRRGCLQR